MFPFVFSFFFHMVQNLYKILLQFIFQKNVTLKSLWVKKMQEISLNKIYVTYFIHSMT